MNEELNKLEKQRNLYYMSFNCPMQTNTKAYSAKNKTLRIPQCTMMLICACVVCVFFL